MVSSQDERSIANSRPELSAAAAMNVLLAARAKAAEIGVPVVLSVVDDGGNLKAFLRMDETPLGAVQWSIDKALTAASFRTPTHVLDAAMQELPSSVLGSFLAQPHATLAPAGFPLAIGDVVVGAIGASGGNPQQDQTVAEAGVAALE